MVNQLQIVLTCPPEVPQVLPLRYLCLSPQWLHHFSQLLYCVGCQGPNWLLVASQKLGDGLQRSSTPLQAPLLPVCMQACLPLCLVTCVACKSIHTYSVPLMPCLQLCPGHSWAVELHGLVQVLPVLLSSLLVKELRKLEVGQLVQGLAD